MNRIKYLLGTLLLGTVLYSCQQQQTPKAVATEFVQRLYALDFDEAGKLATADAQPLLQQSRQQLEARTPLNDERARRAATPAETLFDMQSFTEAGSGDEVTVQNNQLRLALHKDGGSWKVAAAAEVVDALVNYPVYADAVHGAWSSLQSECDKRTKLVQDYLSLRTNSGDNSPELQALQTAARDCSGAKTGSAAERADYLARQARLEAALAKGLSPVMNASADFSMTYIVQINESKKIIEAARQQYNSAAAKARSKDYPPMP